MSSDPMGRPTLATDAMDWSVGSYQVRYIAMDTLAAWVVHVSQEWDVLGLGSMGVLWSLASYEHTPWHHTG